MEPEVKRWKDRLTTAYDKAVPLLGNLLDDGDIQLKLVAAKCLTHDQTAQVSRTIKAEGVKQGAREVFQIIRRRPDHCFVSFCKVLLDLDQPGRDLYVCLNPSQEAAMSHLSETGTQSSKQVNDRSGTPCPEQVSLHFFRIAARLKQRVHVSPLSRINP